MYFKRKMLMRICLLLIISGSYAALTYIFADKPEEVHLNTLSPDEADAIISALYQLEITKITWIEHLTTMKTPYEESNKGFRLESSGLTDIIVYLSDDNSVYAVRHAGKELYKEGRTFFKLTELSNHTE